MTRKPSSRRSRSSDRYWEIVSAGLGALFVVGSIGYLVYYGFAHSPSPPELAVENIGISNSAQGQHHVRFRVHNEGNSTAAAVIIRGRLLEGETVMETAEAIIDYVPELSEREGGLYFSHDPTAYKVELGAAGYADP